MFWFIINFTLCLVFVKVWPKEDLFFEITQITLKTMYPSSHHQNGFAPTQALEHRFFIVYKNLFFCMCLCIISIIYVQFYQVLLYTYICIFNRLSFVTYHCMILKLENLRYCGNYWNEWNNKKLLEKFNGK